MRNLLMRPNSGLNNQYQSRLDTPSPMTTGMNTRVRVTRGNGVFQEFRNNDIQNLGLGALDYTSLASKNVLKSLIVRSLRSVPNGSGRAVDSDGDGLKDDLDQPFAKKSNKVSIIFITIGVVLFAVIVIALVVAFSK